MDQSDIEYEQIKKELKTEMFVNRCRQERLREHLYWLEKKRELETKQDEAEERGKRNSLEEELGNNQSRQETIREQLQGMEEKLGIVIATADGEDYFQNVGTEVGWW